MEHDGRFLCGYLIGPLRRTAFLHPEPVCLSRVLVDTSARIFSGIQDILDKWDKKTFCKDLKVEAIKPHKPKKTKTNIEIRIIKPKITNPQQFDFQVCPFAGHKTGFNLELNQDDTEKIIAWAGQLLKLRYIYFEQKFCLVFVVPTYNMFSCSVHVQYFNAHMT